MRTKKDRIKQVRKCRVCQKSIVGSSYKYNAHLYKHGAIPARFRCTFCMVEFFRSDEFKRHLERHTGRTVKKYFTCDHCGRNFVNKRNLVLHLKIHDDSLELKYKCIACGASYCEERLLKYHIRKTHYNLHGTESAHTNKELNETWIEPLKESEICVEMTKINTNVLYIKRSDVFKQEREINLSKIDPSNVKTEFKEYMSSIFAQKDKSQYSKAKCDYCHKEMLKKSLLMHIREKHMNLKQFHCEGCNRSFTRRYRFVDHDCGKAMRKRRAKVKTE